MLIIRDQAYFDRVVRFACEKGLAEALFEQLLLLHTYGDRDLNGAWRVELSRDFAPASFSLVWRKRRPDGEYAFFVNGGLIFHGDQRGWVREDGTPLSAPVPTFATRLSADENPWSIHT
jgi:hypothetical protein